MPDIKSHVSQSLCEIQTLNVSHNFGCHGYQCFCIVYEMCIESEETVEH